MAFVMFNPDKDRVLSFTQKDFNLPVKVFKDYYLQVWQICVYFPDGTDRLYWEPFETSDGDYVSLEDVMRKFHLVANY